MLNVGDVVVVMALLALVVLAAWLMRRTRVRGGCACCPHAGTCQKASRHA